MVVFARIFRQVSITVAFALVLVFAVPTGAGLAVSANREAILPPIDSPVPSVTLPKFPAGDFSLTPEAEAKSSLPLSKSHVQQVHSVKSGATDSGFSDVNSVVESRRTFETVFTNADGTHTSMLSKDPLNVRSDSGIWVPISTKLHTSARGSARVVDNPINPIFAPFIGESSLYSMSDGVYTVNFGLRDAAKSKLSVPKALLSSDKGNRAYYRNVFPATDVQFEVQPGQVKETLVLREVPLVHQWTFTISAPELTLVKDEWGDIEFRDAAGNIRFTIPAPYMWDSSGVEGVREPEMKDVPTTLSGSGGSYTLALNPSHSWLTSDDRVYPVFVDPTAGWNPTDDRAFKSDGAKATGVIYVGNSRDGNTNKYWRTAVHFGYEGIFTKQVTNASIYGHLLTGTKNGYVGTINVATCLAYGCVGEQLSTYIVPIDGWAVDAGLTNRLAQWVRDGSSGHYLMMRGYEASVYSYKRLDMALYADWKDYPTAGTLVAPSPANAGVSGTTPTLSVSGAAAAGFTSYYRYKVSENPNPDVATIYTSQWSGAQQQQVPEGAGLLPGHTYYWKGEVKDNYDGYYGTPTTRASAVFSFTVNAPPPSTAQSTSSPSDGQIVTNLTPTFSTSTVVDPNGEAVKYQFRVATGADGKTGAVISSGWLTTPSWQVPAGTLQDGGAYSWVVLTSDSINDLESTWVNHFQVNLRVGSAGPSPTDSAGAVTVNLANGNANLSFASPMVGTVGGPMGLSFNYNSLQSPDQFRGLIGSYYSAIPTGGGAATYDFTGKVPTLVRTDPAIGFDWGTESPGPAVPADDFLARWSGYVTAPVAGEYTFGFTRDGRAKLTVGGTVVVDDWTSAIKTDVVWGSSKTLTTTPTPIVAEYAEQSGSANIHLWVKVADGDPNGFEVPSDWFTTRVVSLPRGWSASAPIAGGAGAYASASVSESSVVLTDVSGGVHTYVKKSAGGYTTPVGEYGVMSLDAAGNIVLTEDDGTVYAFNAEGKVTSMTSPADSLKSATPILSYRPGTGQLDRISDPLSKSGTPVTYAREVVFVYAGDSVSSVGLGAGDTLTADACNVKPGYSAPPAGMLCRIVYPGHVEGAADTTQLLYNANGQLAAVLDPGEELSSFDYNAEGRMSGIRNSLASDWLVANPGGSQTMTMTNFAYDASGRLVGVTLPAPDGATASARPHKTYTYGDGVTYVDVAGLTVPNTAPSNGHAATVTYDSSFRQLTATSAAGLTGSQTWNNRDMKLSATDAWGHMATTIYDSQDRATDSYGPAPASCFDANRVPLVSCAITPAHTHTSYDAGLNGLNAKYYDN
ncbi:MAG: PA14 domain-containing protein, partial [Terrimesophilobacter sp.]